jgi:hypothetical protein
MQFMGSCYNPNPGYTLENPKGAERVVALTIRLQKSRAFQTCIHFYYVIIGVSYPQKLSVYTRKSKMSWESCSTCHSTQEKKGFSNLVCVNFYYAIIGVSYTENPGYTLENPKWAERVVVLTTWRRENMAFQYVSTLTVRSLGSHDHLQNLTSSKRFSEDQFQKLNLIYSTIIFDNGIFKNNHCNFLIISYTVISLLGLNQKGVDTPNKRGRTMYLP